MQVPRYLPDVPFPPYTFVPVRAPHPLTDPRGHSYGIPPPAPEPLDPDAWQSCRAYLRGVDLFNHGYYWEAHEAWECAWNGSGRKGTVADFLKALIKLAAAGVKVRQRMPAGVERHASRAAELLHALQQAGRERLAGLHLSTLVTFARDVAATPADPAAPESGALFSFFLQPR